MISGFIMGLIHYYFVQLQGGVINDMHGDRWPAGVYWMETGMRATMIVTHSSTVGNIWDFVWSSN